MIEREIRDIVEDAADDGARLNEIADQFRRGRDVNELVALLDSGDAELVSIGAWILGELRFELYDIAPIMSRLWNLIDHEDPAVRFGALGALYPALDWQDVGTRALLRRLRNDANEGVRMRAEAATTRLSK